MAAVLIILVLIVLAWALAFVGVPLLGWLAAYAIVYLLLLATDAIGVVGGVLLALPLLVLAMLAVKPLRRSLLTRHVLHWFKDVLPEMSATEREAIEAGERALAHQDAPLAHSVTPVTVGASPVTVGSAANETATVQSFAGGIDPATIARDNQAT